MVRSRVLRKRRLGSDRSGRRRKQEGWNVGDGETRGSVIRKDDKQVDGSEIEGA